ncbi:hypothetical protein [Alkalimarinus alittae]|uniref:DUF4145 domain-containing protein n=1 Tax=Alkalimarinus alittae TaxID=2961619 RepID=A0ABY6MXC5_9ALTE|nr:hypothetical protein [Alkalimarinus alittae]UZE94444.1 hypothetical protein NKI27_10095 [Alkalimarinus alittae]
MTQVAYLSNATTLKSTDNYAFLQHTFPELYRVSSEADKYYATDHSCCLLKARLFVELWCHEVSDRLNLTPPISGDLVDKINQISICGKVPPYIIEALNEVRREANKSAHITQCFDGQWTSDTSVSKTRLKRLMTSVFELAQYLAFKLNNQAEDNKQWQEPVVSELAEQVVASLSGNKDATFSLAERASSLIELSVKQGEVTGNEKKEHIKLLQRDLSYWLDKAHRQGHHETWLMYANVYIKKQLMLPESQTIDSCFKHALKVDTTGEAAYQFGMYLMARSQYKRGLDLVLEAGGMAHHQAIRILQEIFYKKDHQQYLAWVSAGVDALEKRSFTLDLENKISQWEQDVNNDVLKKKAKTALISAESRQSDGALYYRGYCTLKGYWGKQPETELGLKSMVDHYPNLPQFLHYEHQLFNLIKSKSEYIDEALSVSDRALKACETTEEKAQVKFDMAMIIWEKLRECNKVKSPHSMKQLIRDAARESCSDAIQFIKSPKGKALMRDGSYACVKTKHSSVDRKKQKQAKKLARKARR